MTMPNATQTVAKAKPSQLKPVAKNNNKKDAAGSKRFHAKGKWSKKREPESDEENDSSDDVKSIPAKKHCIWDEEPEVESASEAEMVGNGELLEPKVEEVDDGGHEDPLSVMILLLTFPHSFSLYTLCMLLPHAYYFMFTFLF